MNMKQHMAAHENDGQQRSEVGAVRDQDDASEANERDGRLQ